MSHVIPPPNDGICQPSALVNRQLSRIGVPAAQTGRVLDFLLQRFPHIGKSVWLQRLQDGQVLDARAKALQAHSLVQETSHIYYRRHIAQERQIPFAAQILFQNEHILVADKPHFLPVMPAGQYVQQTLLARLRQQTGLYQLVPLHRIDKDTAGLVLFSVQPTSRNAYHALFRERRVKKSYQAIAPFDERFLPLYEHSSRLVQHPQSFFRMQQVAGQSNSLTRLQLMQRNQNWARYWLEPVTGKRHQLRVHLAALGIPILHDALYPLVNDVAPGDYSKPLQLLAQELLFTDPLSDQPMRFTSRLVLNLPTC